MNSDNEGYSPTAFPLPISSSRESLPAPERRIGTPRLTHSDSDIQRFRLAEAREIQAVANITINPAAEELHYSGYPAGLNDYTINRSASSSSSNTAKTLLDYASIVPDAPFQKENSTPNVPTTSLKPHIGPQALPSDGPLGHAAQAHVQYFRYPPSPASSATPELPLADQGISYVERIPSKSASTINDEEAPPDEEFNPPNPFDIGDIDVVPPTMTADSIDSNTASKRALEPLNCLPSAFQAHVRRQYYKVLQAFYLLLLLRLPLFYRTRVILILNEVHFTKKELIKTAISNLAKQQQRFQPHQTYSAYSVDSAKLGLKKTWEDFIDSLIREWKINNIISILLVTAITSTLQIEAASSDALVRNVALVSLLCSLMSLLYGSIYIVRFSMMRPLHKAVEWALEERKNVKVVLWNVWVLLSMPAVWLSWSLVIYVICVMSFAWRTSPGNKTVPVVTPTHNASQLAANIVLSIILLVGLIYFALIINTLRRYGGDMDKTWINKVQNAAEAQGEQIPRAPMLRPSWTPSSTITTNELHYTPPSIRTIRLTVLPRRSSIETTPNSIRAAPTVDLPPVTEEPSDLDNSGPEDLSVTDQPLVIKVMELHPGENKVSRLPAFLPADDEVVERKWNQFVQDVSNAWLDVHQETIDLEGLQRLDTIPHYLAHWNISFFQTLGMWAVLCRETPATKEIGVYPKLAVYLTDLSSDPKVPFGRSLKGLHLLEAFDVTDPSRSQRGFTDRIGHSDARVCATHRWTESSSKSLENLQQKSLSVKKRILPVASIQRNHTQSVLHPALWFHSAINYDLRIPPVPRFEFEYETPATTPPSTSLVLYHPLLPWTISVTREEMSSVTIYDVILQIWQQLDIEVQDSEWISLGLGLSNKREILNMLSERYSSDGEGSRVSTGLRRADFLGNNVIFEGLVQGIDGMWEMKTGTAQEKGKASENWKYNRR
ncbi:hypothetical protein Hypma_002736 [Hypsizygus marmoreus]|uniref:DUF6699 domain-containing protein n=1 Tax=Hypsizygus marmoreus TaxID=39966 RepID=A0A369JA80_HYPMA|nr:hypothetical protein Hypma_002736 [Hypsizygus marmoreus]